MTTIAEARDLKDAAKPSEGSGMLEVTLITPGWGSSGYYSADVLEAAGTERVFPAGTHMYMNHPTATENYERPVRDLTQLAAVLVEDAVWDGESNALKSKAKVFSTWGEPLAEMAEYIGVSVRAGAEVTEGSAEGRDGIIVERLTEGISVDFVTRPGRGGSYEVLESAFSKGVVATAHVKEAVTGDVRDALSNMVRDANPSEKDNYVYSWVRDYDTTSKTVYFEREDNDGSGVFAQSFETDEGGLPTSLVGDPVEVRVSTTYVPVAAPSGQSTSTEESQEDTMPTIEEARLNELVAAEASVATLSEQRDQYKARAEEAEKRAALAVTNFQTATRIVGEAFREHNVSAPSTQARLAAGFEVNEDGTVNEESLKQAASETAAEIAEAAGVNGQVRNLGDTKTPDGDISEAEFNERLAKFSGRTTVKEA